MTEEAAANKPVRKLAESDFHLTEHRQQMFTMIPQVGTTREDVLNPVFWTHVARRIQPMAEVRCMPKDGDWYGTFLVMYSDAKQVVVRELSYTKLGNVEASGAEIYVIKWVSPACKWGVIRKEDKERVKDGFGTQEAALRWVQQQKQSMA